MKRNLELYLHIPFCAAKCNYCDFLSFSSDSETRESYVRQLIMELGVAAKECEPYSVSSIFIGGGTPSVLPANDIALIMDCIFKNYDVMPDAEITIECNPASALLDKFEVYRSFGINRLSIGLQSADNNELKILGRIHTVEDFLKSYEAARRSGFENINVDLIDCIPMQSIRTWKKSLRQVTLLKPEHISVYNLIVEEGTPFGDMYRKGQLLLPDEDEQAKIDDFTLEFLEKQGYVRYEISNFAKPGFECRHNKGYWTGTPYIGFGIGAASFFNDMRWNNTSDIKEYMELDLKNNSKYISYENPVSVLRGKISKLKTEEEMEEFMFLGLRMTEGISEDEFRLRFGRTLISVYGRQLVHFTSNGLMAHNGSRYYLTKRGMELANQVMSEFLLT